MTNWRSAYLKTMGQRMEAILNKDIPGISHDVLFIVGEDKVKISCHKLLLMAASPVFEVMLSERHSGQNASDGSEIVHSNCSIKLLTKDQENEISESGQLTICIPDVMPAGLKNLIKYAYNHILNVEVKDALDTMYAAHKYDIKELVEHCGERLHSKMSVQNVVIIHQAALLLNDIELAKNSWEYIQQNAGGLLTSQQFLEFSEDNLCKFLKLDEMPTVGSEAHVFKAVLRWGNNQCKKEMKTTSKENVRETLTKIIPLIRFPTMGHLEFLDIVEPSGILNETECYNICKHFLLTGQRQLSNLKTMNYPFQKRNGHRFVFCAAIPTERFSVSESCKADSFIVTGEIVHLKSVGIVLSQKYAQTPDVIITIAVGVPREPYSNMDYFITRKRVLKCLQMVYVEFDQAVTIKPNVKCTVTVNMDSQGSYAKPMVSFVQYMNDWVQTPTRSWITTFDRREVTLTFYPGNCVIWALHF